MHATSVLFIAAVTAAMYNPSDLIRYDGGVVDDEYLVPLIIQYGKMVVPLYTHRNLMESPINAVVVLGPSLITISVTVISK